MISLKGLAAGLLALLSADTVIASPCKVSLSTTSTHALSSSVPISTETISSSVSVDLTTSTVETTFPSSFTETTSIAIVSSDVFSTTESAATTEETTSADATITTQAMSTSTDIASTTEQLPPVLPTIANAGFDDNSVGYPWTGTSQVNSAAVYWKRSAPSIMLIRPGRYTAQEVIGLRTDSTYRIRFYWVKFDDPRDTAGCKVMVSFGGSSLGGVALLRPRTPNNVFEEFSSTPFQPSTASAELRIEHTCSEAGQTNRFYIDEVSIEFA